MSRCGRPFHGAPCGARADSGSSVARPLTVCVQYVAAATHREKTERVQYMAGPGSLQLQHLGVRTGASDRTARHNRGRAPKKTKGQEKVNEQRNERRNGGKCQSEGLRP